MDVKLNWLDLPSHILSLIPEKSVRVKDCVRFGAVCHLLRSVLVENGPRLPRQLPMLMLSTDCNLDCKKRFLYDLCEEKIYNMKLSVPHEIYCIGSSEGWLVTIGSDLGICLFNPFLSSVNEIKLPLLTTIEDLEANEVVKDSYLYKSILSANPRDNPNYVVMAIYGRYQKLAYYKPGNKAWISLPQDFVPMFDDIIYYKEQFQVMDEYGALWFCDLNCSNPEVFVANVPSLNENPYNYQNYIVESSGELLQLRRIWKNMDGYTARFEVFKLDEIKCEWVEVDNLCGQMLFVGDNTSVSLLASEFPGCKPNCIYFREEIWLDKKNDGHCDMGVYNMNDGRIEPLCSMDSKPVNFPAPIWIEPTLEGYPN